MLVRQPTHELGVTLPVHFHQIVEAWDILAYCRIR